MSWGKIKKAINSDLTTPLNTLINNVKTVVNSIKTTSSNIYSIVNSSTYGNSALNTKLTNTYNIVNNSTYGNSPIKTAINSLQTTANTIDTNVDTANSAITSMKSTLSSVASDVSLIATNTTNGVVRWTDILYSSGAVSTTTVKGTYTIVDCTKVVINVSEACYNPDYYDISWNVDLNNGSVPKLTAKTRGFRLTVSLTEYY